VSSYEVRLPIAQLLANPASADAVSLHGTLGSYEIKIDKTKAANNLKIHVYAKTMGRVEIF
jgi:hypothetical protein